MNDVIKALDKATNGKKTMVGALAYMVMTFGVNQGWWMQEAVSAALELAMNLGIIGGIHKVDKLTRKGK